MDADDPVERHPIASGREPDSERARRRLVEAVLDNLPAWAFIALAIAALYMVWATLVILETYVGGQPGVKP
jgi:hypothetical protein